MGGGVSAVSMEPGTYNCLHCNGPGDTPAPSASCICFSSAAQMACAYALQSSDLDYDGSSLS